MNEELVNFLERAMGIEPTSQAWEAHILPLNHARRTVRAYTNWTFLLQ